MGGGGGGSVRASLAEAYKCMSNISPSRNVLGIRTGAAAAGAGELEYGADGTA